MTFPSETAPVLELLEEPLEEPLDDPPVEGDFSLSGSLLTGAGDFGGGMS